MRDTSLHHGDSSTGAPAAGNSSPTGGNQCRTPVPASHRAHAIFLWTTVVLTVAPVVLDLAMSSRRRAFSYLAADTFYYLTVARNIVHHGMVSFDQTHPTNGFHPLWQFLLAGVFGVGALFRVPEPTILTFVVLLNALLVGVGVCFLCRAMLAARPALSPLVLLLPIGPYALLISPLWWSLSPLELARQNPFEGSMPLYGTLWSYMNGMESSLVILFYGLVAWWFVTRDVVTSTRSAALFGVLLTLFLFSRLDHVFLPLAILVVLLAWTFRDGVRAMMPALITGGIVAAALALYLLVNLLYVGSLLPVSGLVKNEFPATSGKLVVSMMVQILGRDGQWLYRAWRLTQIFVPALCAVGLLMWRITPRPPDRSLLSPPRTPAARFDRFVELTAVAVLLLASYDFVFVNWINQGHWYFPMSVLWVSLVAIGAADGRAQRLIRNQRKRITAWAVLCIGVTSLYFLGLHRKADYHLRYARFYFEEADKVKAHYGASMPKLLEDDDGIVAFSTGFPTMSAKGFMADPEAVPYFRSRTQGDLAVARGHDHFTSLVYANYLWLDSSVPSRNVKLWTARNFPILRDPSRYDFAVDYRSPRGDFAIVKVGPAPP